MRLGLGLSLDGAPEVATAAPAISSLSISLGDPLGGDTVVITGTALFGATAVAFGATAATSFTVDSATQITAVSPAHAAGSVNIVVTTPEGSSSGTAYEFWSPAVLAPQAFWDGGNYTVATWATRSQAYATNLDATSATAPTPANGNPDFIRANLDNLDPNAGVYLQQVVGQDDMAFAVVLDVDSISAQADDEKADGVITDHQMWLALLLGGAASNKAIFLYAQSGGDKKASITVPTSGRMVIIARKVSNVMQISINGGVAWTTGDTCDAGLGGHSAPIHIGWNRFASLTGAVGYFDGRMKALMAHNATISDANALKFYNWAAVRHP